MPDNPAVGRKAPTAAQTDFAVHLMELDKGRVHDDATTRLDELISAVLHTAKPGTLTLKIKVEPMDPNGTFVDTGALIVSGNVTVAKPQIERGASIFYSTGIGGQMTRQAPRDADDPRDDPAAA